MNYIIYKLNQRHLFENDDYFLLQPIYGFASGGPFRFRKAIGHRDLFYTDDREVDFKDVRCWEKLTYFLCFS